MLISEYGDIDKKCLRYNVKLFVLDDPSPTAPRCAGYSVNTVRIVQVNTDEDEVHLRQTKKLLEPSAGVTSLVLNRVSNKMTFTASSVARSL